MDDSNLDYIVPLGNSNESGHVVPVDHIYPITMAGFTSFTFTPKHIGQIDRDFPEITPSDKIYCYQEDRGSGMKKAIMRDKK